MKRGQGPRRGKAAQGIAALAKLTPPRLAATYPRARLFRQLDAARGRAVAWLSAPAGYGKTTLAASYLAARKIRPLWYHIDERDDDPAAFFYYLRQALIRQAPRKRETLSLLTPEYLPNLSVFARNFFDAAFERLRSPAALVLDDYHTLSDDAALHALLPKVFAGVPDGVRVLVLSRSSPPPSFAQLEANQIMQVLGAEALSLTRDEVRGIARLHDAGELTPKTLDALYSRIRGWVAAWTLLFERSRTGELAAADIPGGAREALFDYFVAELFEHTAPDVQDLLLKTALLPQVSPPIAEALTGAKGAGATLARLERRNYFITRLTAPEPIYQFHPLFREFLLSRQHQALTAAERGSLQRAAARLLRDHGQHDEASALLVGSADWDGLIELILAQAPSLVQQGRVSTLQTWIEALPPTRREEDPWLEYWFAVCRLFRDPGEARGRFGRAYEEFKRRDDGRGQYYAWAGVVHPVMMQWGGYSDIDRWLAELSALEHRAPLASYPDVEPQVAFSALTLLSCSGEDRSEISRWAARMEALSDGRAADERVQLLVLVGLNIHYYWSGAAEQARRARERLVKRLGAAQADPITQLQCYMALVGNSMFTGDLAFGERWAEAGLRLGERIGVRMSEALFIAHAVYRAEQTQDLDGADAALARYRQVVFPDNRVDEAHYCYLAAGLAWQRGDLASARAQIERGVFLCEQMQLRAHLAHLRLMFAEILVEFGELGRAASLREQALEYAQRADYPALVAHCELAAAWIALRRSDEVTCAAALAGAFAFGRRARCALYMGWNARMNVPLCEFALARDIEPGYARFLIQNWHLPPSESGMRLENWPWPVRIRVLGRFSVQRDDKPLPAADRGGKPLDLLKALVALGGRAVAETELAEMLWPDADGDRALASLKVNVHRLRRILGEERIMWSNGLLSLDARSVWVDAWALERALGALESALADRQGVRVAALAKGALALHRGPYLRGESSAWALGARERLRAKFLRVVAGAAEILTADRNAAEAARCYEKALEVDPAAERLYQGLMRCHLDLGQRADGLAVYKRCRETLARELALAPSPKTEALRSSLLSG